jgi:hypothetical protein
MPMAASRTLEIIVKAKDEASAVLKDIEFRAQMIGIVLSKTASAASSAFSKIQNTLFSLKGILGGIGFGVLAHSFIEVGRETEALRLRYRMLTGDVDKANQLFESAAKYALETSFGYRNVMDTVAQFRSVVKGGNEEAMKWTRLSGDLAAATGMNINQVTDQITRMYQMGSSGSLMFMRQGVLSMLGLQAGVTLSAEQTRKKLMEMWESPTSAFRGAAQEVSKTWDGIMASIGDKWLLLRDLIMNEGGVFNYLKAAMVTTLNSINSFAASNPLKEWAKTVGSEIINQIENVIVAAALLGDAFRGWQIIWQILKGTFGLLVYTITTGLEKIEEGIQWVIEGFAKIIEADLKKSFLMADVFGMNPLRNSAEAILKTLKEWGDELGERRKGLQEGALLAKQIEQSAEREGFELAMQVPLYVKAREILKEIRDLAISYNEVTARGGGVGGKDAPLLKASSVLKSAMDRFKADMLVDSAMLKSQYAQRLIDLAAYYDKRREHIIKLSEAEIQLQKDLLKTQDVQRDPEKVMAITTKIYELEKKQIVDLMTLEQERRDKQKEEAQRRLDIELILANIKDRAIAVVPGTGGGLQAGFDKEMRDLDNRQQAELKSLREKLATVEQLEDASRNQRLEKDRLLADQQRRAHEFYIQQALDFTGNLEKAFGDIYEATGKKIKAFFYLQKAASIATTIIQTYESAVKAFNALADIPYVGPALGYAAAAAAIAAGMARVAVIASTQPGAAEGGKIEGFSPNQKADNLTIRATAGEFMQPVDTVKYYGLDVMEGLRRRTLPKSLFKGFQVPSITESMSKTNFAIGGLVTGGRKDQSKEKSAKLEDRLTINNILDPTLFAQYIASVPGEKQLLNFINNNSYQVRAMVLG